MRKRLDQIVVERGFFPTRSKAKQAIQAQLVLVESRIIDKPGLLIDESSNISIIEDPEFSYVSRGGLKLQEALNRFEVNAEGSVAIDVGASTGGFTDCLLRHGARRVYAVDVGTDQLHPILRQDPRVVVMEQTNIRYLTPESLPEQCSLATVDVAFISLTKFFAVLLSLLTTDADIVTLIKPQFEVGPSAVSKGGIVRNLKIHKEMLVRVCTELQECGCSLRGLKKSPITGSDGNTEYLAHFKKGMEPIDCSNWVNKVIDRKE